MQICVFFFASRRRHTSCALVTGVQTCALPIFEFKDATPEERAETLCNSGLMAVRARDLFALLARVGNENAAGEYYLPDIVMLASADGRASAVIETDAHEEIGRAHV